MKDRWGSLFVDTYFHLLFYALPMKIRRLMGACARKRRGPEDDIECSNDVATEPRVN